jgi:heat shock protein HtpX
MILLNWFKTVILFGLLSSLVFAISYLLGGEHALYVAAALALVMNGIAYFFSDRIVMSMYKTTPITEKNHPMIYAMVQELTGTMQLPMPKVFLIKSEVANAFATGRNPQHASIALTEGIIDILSPRELRAVIAHELAHVSNRDILIGTMAAMMASIIGYLAYWLRSAVMWGNNRKKSPLHPIILILVTILVPLVATLVQLAISRSREYQADETGAHCCHDPLSLASALEKMHEHTTHAHFNSSEVQKASMAHLFIINPFTDKKITSLFSTHPPISARIARLKALYEKQLHLR